MTDKSIVLTVMQVAAILLVVLLLAEHLPVTRRLAKMLASWAAMVRYAGCPELQARRVEEWAAVALDGTAVSALATCSGFALSSLLYAAAIRSWALARRHSLTSEGEQETVLAPGPAIPQADMDLPAQVPTARNAATMVISGMTGLASGFVMAAATHQALLLLVSVLGPLAPLTIYVIGRIQHRQRYVHPR